MNLDTKSTVANAVFSGREMLKNANSTQVKRFQDANTSFASEMAASSGNPENNENVNSSLQTEETSKSDNDVTSETSKKSEKTNLNKISNEQSSENKSSDIEVNADNKNQIEKQSDVSASNTESSEFGPLSGQVQAYLNANGLDMNSFVSVNSMYATEHSQISGMPAVVDYSTVQMSDSDAKFFADLVSGTDMNAASVAAEFEKAMRNENVKMVQSTAKASLALIEALKESSKNHQAFRIDFDKDISVIMQVDRGGKINANFIPGDIAVENYLRNNIDSLRQRFSEKEIAYGDLTYSQSRKNKNEQDRKSNKENR